METNFKENYNLNCRKYLFLSAQKVAGHKLDYDCKKRHGAQVKKINSWQAQKNAVVTWERISNYADAKHTFMII